MKHNYSAETQKKLVLSSLLIAALAGPSIFHVSSKTTGSSEMATTAPAAPAACAAPAKPAEAGSLQELQQKLDLATCENAKLKLEAEAKKAAEDKRIADEAAAKAEVDRLAAKKKKEEVDCDKKEKAIDRSECKRNQKEEAAEIARESLKNDFEESLAVAKDVCETRASRKSDLDQEALVASCMADKMGSVLRQYKNKKVNGVRVQLDKATITAAYREHIGGVLNQLLYSDDAESEMKAQGILQSIMSSQIPSQYADVKRQAMLDVRAATNKELTEVVAEYRKMNSPEMRNNKELRDQQELVAGAKRSQLQSQLENYGSIVEKGVTLTSASDMTAFQYFKSTFSPDMRKILTGLWGIKPGAVAEGDSTRGARGTVEAGVARDSANRGIVQTGGDQKMRQTGAQGIEYPITNRTNSSNFVIEERTTSATGSRTGRVQVGTAK